MNENINNAEKYVLTQLRLERLSREAWQDGVVEKINHMYDEIIKAKDAIEEFDVTNEENAQTLEAVGDKVGEFIRRIVILEDAVQRIANNEQTDAQGYKWIFSPEDAIQRIAALETELGRSTHTHDQKVEIRTREHLEKCIEEKNMRIKLLENMLDIRNNEFEILSRNAQKLNERLHHFQAGDLLIGTQRPNGFVELNGLDK